MWLLQKNNHLFGTSNANEIRNSRPAYVLAARQQRLSTSPIETQRYFEPLSEGRIRWANRIVLAGITIFGGTIGLSIFFQKPTLVFALTGLSATAFAYCVITHNPPHNRNLER